MRKLAFVLGMIAFLGLAVAEVPEFPHTVEGDVTVNGEDYTGSIEVRYDGEVLDTTQAEEGVFGGETDPLVPSGIESGSEMKFYVDGIETDTTLGYESGAVEDIELSINIQNDQPTQVSKTVSQSEKDNNRVNVELPEVASKENSGVSQININVDEDDSEGVSEVNVTVSSDAENEEVGEVPVEDQEDNVHGNIDVDTNNDDAVENAEIDFKVSKDRIDEDEISRIVLFHFENGDLVETLETTYLDDVTDDRSDDYYYFESETTSFSSFTIASDNQDPDANIVADASSIDEGEEVEFDGSESSDNVGIESYSWDFDDGESATGETVTHTFEDPGDYDVELTVTDESGNTDTETVRIEVDSVDTGSSTTNVASDDSEQQQTDQEDQTEEETTQTDETSDQESGQDQASEQSNDQQDSQGQNETTEQTDTEPETPPNEQGNPQTPTGLFSAENSGLIGVILLVLIAAVAYAQRTGRIDLQSYYSSLADKVARQETDSTSQEYEFK